MIYLASQSPRRAELLMQINVSFSIVNGTVEEQQAQNESPEDYVLRLAINKAQAGFRNSKKDKPVLGADTVVVLENRVFEKPLNQQHAAEMMRCLSGNKHQVYTAIAMSNGTETKSKLVITDVTFKTLSDNDIVQYWETKEPLGKAGGYGIQGQGAQFITHINGSYTGVVGLPLYETNQLIKKFIKD